MGAPAGQNGDNKNTVALHTYASTNHHGDQSAGERDRCNAGLLRPPSFGVLLRRVASCSPTALAPGGSGMAHLELCCSGTALAP